MKKFQSLLQILLIFVLLAGCQTATPTAEPTAAATLPSTETPLPTLTPLPPTETPIPEPTLVPALDESQKWWNEAVFYEVFVRSFYDSNGDGNGDINGLTEKLDYLQSLGVNALWLMPINPSPSYHGYDVTDYYDVNPTYGTKEDFKRLMEEAHKRDMRVIIDLVLNHTSTKHPWFQKSVQGDPEYQDYYMWADSDPGFKGPWNQKVWHTASNKKFYYAIFWDQMPDLNLENPAVKAEVQNIIKFWLTDMNVDGFRLDAVRHYVEEGSTQENTPATHAWLKEFYQYYRSVKPDAFTIGEAWTSTPLIVPYVGDEVETAFEFDLAKAFMTAAVGPFADPASDQLKLVLSSYPKGQYGVFLTNHDQDRAMSTLKDESRAKLAAALYLTAPGIPFIYYGEEIGMTGAKPDEDIRRPMQWVSDSPKLGFTTGLPWEAPSRDYKLTSVATQDANPDSLLNYYRSLLKLRRENSALRTGETIVLNAGSPRLYAVLRYDEQAAFLILANVHPFAVTSDIYGISLPKGPFSGPVKAASVLGLADPAAPEINSDGGFSNYLPFAEIPSQSVTIIQLTP